MNSEFERIPAEFVWLKDDDHNLSVVDVSRMNFFFFQYKRLFLFALPKVGRYFHFPLYIMKCSFLQMNEDKILF